MEDNVEVLRPKEQNELKIGIVGLGFVGKAVNAGWSSKRCNKMVVDPKFNKNTMSDLYDFAPQITFICLPTPSNDDGSINSELVEKTVRGLIAGS